MRALPAALAVACAASGPARAAAPAPEAGPPRAVLARVERAEARLGVPFAYEIEVVHPAREALAIAPTLDAPPFRGEGGACRGEPAGPGTDRIRTTCRLRLALYDLGPHDLPPVRLAVRTADGEASLEVEGPRVAGVGLTDPAAPPSALALRPLAPPVALLVPTWAPAGWALGIAAAAAAVLLARRAARRRARRAAEPPAPEPPEVRLARRLDALAARRPPAREHFFELSGAVREWVGAVTGLPAPELTTAELADRLAAGADPRVNAPALLAFLGDADLVKFARGDASAERCAQALAWARRLPATAAARAAEERAERAAEGRP